MNSKGIQPRVGMQVRNAGGNLCTVYAISEEQIYMRHRSGSASFFCQHRIGGARDHGLWKIEWTPPTRSERAMFRDAARHRRASAFCFWYAIDSGLSGGSIRQCRQIAVSLAMDGL